MMALAAVFPLGIDGHHVKKPQFPVVCQVTGFTRREQVGGGGGGSGGGRGARGQEEEQLRATNISDFRRGYKQDGWDLKKAEFQFIFQFF